MDNDRIHAETLATERAIEETRQGDLEPYHYIEAGIRQGLAISGGFELARASRRDRFIAAALSGFCSSKYYDSHDEEYYALMATKQADAVLELLDAESAEGMRSGKGKS